MEQIFAIYESIGSKSIFVHPVGPLATSVFINLWSHMNRDSGLCIPAQKVIVEETRYALSTVRRALCELRAAFWVVPLYRYTTSTKCTASSKSRAHSKVRTSTQYVLPAMGYIMREYNLKHNCDYKWPTLNAQISAARDWEKEINKDNMTLLKEIQDDDKKEQYRYEVERRADCKMLHNKSVSTLYTQKVVGGH